MGGCVAACLILTGATFSLFRDSPQHPAVSRIDAATPVADMGDPGDAGLGCEHYLRTCAACHGPEGQGMPHQGANLQASRFVAQQSDAELLAFLQVGRRADEPASTMKLAMPPRGAAPLSDLQLKQIIAHLRQVQRDVQASAAIAPR